MTDVLDVTYRDQAFRFYRQPQTEQIVREIFSDNYRIFERGLDKVIRPGDVILDLGANEGVWSIMMAKLFPGTRIIALEPVSRTFFALLRNISLNGVTSIEPVNMGVGGETGSREFIVGRGGWSGGSTGCGTFVQANHEKSNVTIETLDSIFRSYIPNRCRLLKIDIEGMEYETFYNSTCLDRVDYVVGEFHMNEKLAAQGYDINELCTWVGSKANLVYVERLRMCE